MNIQHNISLKKYNTFGIDVKARQFVEINSLSELKDVVKISKDFFVLGGGSNILLTDDIKNLVIHLNLKGKKIIKETNTHVFIEVSSGENWHDFVIWCIEHDYGGIENLSLIPGNVGTAPIQNIGAYGVELKDSMFELKAFEILTNELKTFKNKDCNFGYRNSVFKNALKGKFIITSVLFKLTKTYHNLNTSYGTIQSELDRIGIINPTIKDISDAVIRIRQSKLPDPKEIGNSGSFFKNPVLSATKFNQLQKKYPIIPHYLVSDKEVKVPAGWLVEQCGFKGKRFGDAGVHNKQALVLVNHGSATGKEILKLSKVIQRTVLENFGIALEAEVNII